MKKSTLLVIIMAVIVVAVLVTVGLTMGKNGAKVCPACGAEAGVVEECETCGGSGEVENPYFATWVSLLAPVIAIVLALITKEAYSSLFIGVIVGGLLAQNFNVVKTLDTINSDGLISAVSGTAGIFVFLVILGILVALVNKAGGSAAFGRWAARNIRSKAGAAIATFVLGVLIFIDDYFNCLTVGGVMRPVTDSQKISRAKLAYLIDATAAPVCMIAPISSWAAAVSGYAPEGQGISLFIQAIPYNLYSLLTFVFIIAITVIKLDYGAMAKKELEAQNGDLGALEATGEDADYNKNGIVLDLILPVVVLVVCCVAALIYNGGFFDPDSGVYLDFINAFANTDATVGLPLGGIVALIFTIFYLGLRKVISFADSMKAVPQGFIAMVPAILILTFATSLKNMTGLLGAKFFVKGIMDGAAAGLTSFLPAVIFLVAVGLSFATGTSWGTFGILIPIVVHIFEPGDQMLIISMSACLAGSVCGDHCSPISDTTIMSSAGAQTNHVDHVATQLPYALTVAGFSFIGYLLLAIEPLRQWYIVLPIIAALMVIALVVIKNLQKNKKV